MFVCYVITGPVLQDLNLLGPFFHYLLESRENPGCLWKTMAYHTGLPTIHICLLGATKKTNVLWYVRTSSFAGPVVKTEGPQFIWSVRTLPPIIKRKFIIYGNPQQPASLQYCLPSHVCLLGGTKSSLGMTSRHHEAVNKQEKELVHYYWELPRQKPTSFGGIKHGRGANWLFQIKKSFLLY